MTRTPNRFFTAAAAVLVATGISMPGYVFGASVSDADLIDLRADTAALEDRAVPANIALVADAEPAAIEESIQILENDLQFPAAGIVSAASNELFSTYALLAQARTTRDTMLLRACTIAEEAAPDPSVWFPNYATVSARVNAIHSAMRLVAETYVPSFNEDISYAAVSNANVEADAIMAKLAEVEPLNPDYLMSTWYYNSLVDVMWNNAKDACDTYSD